GRQPWVVYGVMRTEHAVTPSLSGNDVALSLAAYVISYLIIFGGGLILLRRLVLIGPAKAEEEEKFDAKAHPKRPLSAITDTKGDALNTRPDAGAGEPSAGGPLR
ncbi:MAG: cytochrome ubiquinol oxidase subunit I, partial [Burkholderiaceae bacterium]